MAGVLGLVAKAKPSRDSMADMMGDEPEGDAGTMAAEDFLKAVKSNDASGLYSAFERMKRACEMGPATDESEDDEESGY